MASWTGATGLFAAYVLAIALMSRRRPAEARAEAAAWAAAAGTAALWNAFDPRFVVADVLLPPLALLFWHRSTEVGMADGRVKQNIWRESWVGAIATVGDPLGRRGSWLGGGDFTYATSRFRRDKNFLVGVWGLATGRENLGHDATALGVKVADPNDLWDVTLTSKRIGRDFDPSLGFVPCAGVFLHALGVHFSPRLGQGPVQQMFFEFRPTLTTDLEGRWEGYRVFMAPINWRFRSGDRAQFNVNPTGERLTEPFEIADGVVIPPGAYQWRRYWLEGGPPRSGACMPR